MEGPEFLKKKYNLHAAPEVEQAASRSAARSEGKPQKPLEKIQNYLDRFKEVTEREDESEKKRGMRALKKVLHEACLIRPENIPESYFTLQQQIAREQGHGTIEITPELRAEAIKVIRADQRASLDEWVDYLASDDALYPDWAKYWAFRSVLGMSLYDKEKKQFGNRTKDTTAKFPDLNREALAYVVDVLEKQLRGGTALNPVQEGENEFVEEGKAVSDEDFESLLKTESFPRYYAFAIEHVVADNSELFKITDGEWRRFEKGSDALELTKTLQGRGTGWCTAGESTAASQLSRGDFYVYCSNNAHGTPTIPRLAIRMEGDSIAEVRGVAPQQEIDPFIAEVLETKMQEFGEEGEMYKKKAEQMRKLTRIERMTDAGEDLAPSDLAFLYERDELIQGFGYARDPRIDEIIATRDRYADLKALSEKKDDSEFIVGFLEMDPTARARMLSVRSEDSYDDEDWEWEEYDKAFTSLFEKSLMNVHGLTAEVAGKVLENGYGWLVAERFSSFNPAEGLKILTLLGEYDEEQGTEYHLKVMAEAFDGVSAAEKVAYLESHIEAENFEMVEDLLARVSNVPSRVAHKLVELGHSKLVAENLKSFVPGLGSAIAESLISAGHSESVAENLDVFGELKPRIIHELDDMDLINDPKVRARSRIVKKNPFGQYVEMEADEDFVDPDMFDD